MLDHVQLMIIRCRYGQSLPLKVTMGGWGGGGGAFDKYHNIKKPF